VEYYDVEVGGHTFRVASEKGAQYIQAVAAYVEQKLQARILASKTVLPTRLALMAALDIADELFAREMQERGAEERPTHMH
jgi:cell division protein ZapA (FtsZ GTPase activity inhibitor)